MDSKLFAWVYSHFGEPSEKRIGGQAGIISNQLSFLGQEVLLYSPDLNKHIAELSNPNIKIPVVEKSGKISLKSLSEVHGTPRVNWIFEFEKGLKTKDFVVPRDNRFILSSKSVNSKPVFDVNLKTKLPELGKLVDVCYISGYHRLEDSGDFAEEKHDLGLLKSKNKKLVLHYEYVRTKNPEILSVLPRFDSLGCDEVELRQLLELLGEDKQAKKVSSDDSNSIFEGAALLKKRLKVKRLHVHNLGYALNLYDYKPTLNDVIAMLFASSVTNTKAKFGKYVTFKKQHSFCINEGLSHLGFKALASFYRKHPHLGKNFLESGLGEDFILVPLHVVDKPVYTVGLGDTISSVSLGAEIALKKQSLFSSTIF
ncbi:ADP-specific phosphofructokinase [uncultured archaeon]|nr:ADP-specific phosphofructokinase [uncultured archaeon]